MNQFLYGVIFVSALVATVFFFDFWRRSKDPLFLWFSLAFGLLGFERLVLAFLPWDSEYKVYLIRLLAFVLIIIAVVQKNRRKKS
jgi:hypothetical protein